MFLCVGSALLLLGIQWIAQASNPQSIASKPVVKVRTSQSNDRSVTDHSAAVGTTLKRETKLVLDLSDRQVYVYRNQQRVTHYPVAIGQAGWETPSGSFYVMEMQRDPKWQHPITGEVIPVSPANPLGKRWIGFLHEGRAHIGFHGTNQEELIGQAVSHGCVRMRNRDVVALYDQITIGTAVEVRP
ncbi:MAG: L,D-transpeptidase [Stenomitos rutilans HA7619-LM2]|jgi:lipoprotein-anchoring transpeptidase ErfK/SrfK|nr:L,D-transpeptidase [Stenomitos rutilans HA7619-LM2]